MVPFGACAGQPGRPLVASPLGRRRLHRAARRSILREPPPARPSSRPAGCRPPGRRLCRPCSTSDRRMPAKSHPGRQPSVAVPSIRISPRLIENARTSTSTSPGAGTGSGTSCKAILPGAELSATSARMGQGLRSSVPSSIRSYARSWRAPRLTRRSTRTPGDVRVPFPFASRSVMGPAYCQGPMRRGARRRPYTSPGR